MRSPPIRKGLAPSEPSPQPIPDSSPQKIAPHTVGSQILGPLPGTTWEDIFQSQGEPTLADALDDPELRARYVNRYGELLDEPAHAEQLSLEPKPKIAKKEGRCRACSAEVYWVTTARNRKPLPLDPAPSRDPNHGNFTMVEVDGERLAEYVCDEQRRALIEAGSLVWISHFASCEKRRR